MNVDHIISKPIYCQQSTISFRQS